MSRTKVHQSLKYPATLPINILDKKTLAKLVFVIMKDKTFVKKILMMVMPAARSVTGHRAPVDQYGTVPKGKRCLQLPARRHAFHCERTF